MRERALGRGIQRVSLTTSQVHPPGVTSFRGLIMTTDTLMRNVGSNGSPVSWLHERAVALLYDELTFITSESQVAIRDDAYTLKQVRVRLSPGGDLSDNLLDGVHSTHIPTEWDSVGGVVPDLILRSKEGTPVRIIEVVVTSPPSEEKRRKIEVLTGRGVDCVEINVRTERDLLNLCWIPSRFKFADLNADSIRRARSNMLGEGRPTALKLRNGVEYQGRISVTRWASTAADKQVMEFMDALLSCSPATRRRFLELCQDLSSMDSLLPIHPLNPLRDKLADNSAKD